MMITEWSSAFPEAKRNAAIKKTKLGHLAEVEVSVLTQKYTGTYCLHIIAGCCRTSVLICEKLKHYRSQCCD
jgi:hypothetical protein